MSVSVVRFLLLTSVRRCSDQGPPSVVHKSRRYVQLDNRNSGYLSKILNLKHKENTMKTLRMAIIGSGQIARVTHLPNYQSMPQVEVVGVSDVNIEAAKGLAEQFQIPAYYGDHIQMLEELKPDAVTICVPNRFHCSITLDALNAGCHVMCEKPPAITAEEAELMEKTADEKGLLLTYGFHFRHSEQVAILKKKIQQNEMGTIYHTKIQWNRRRGIPGWGVFTNKSIQGGGPLIDIGAHMLDAALYLLDYPEIDTVIASSSDRIGKRGGTGLMGSWDGERFTVEDGVFGFIRFKDGTSLQMETAFAINQKEENLRNVQLYGDKLGASVFPLEIYGETDGQLTNIDYPFLQMRDWHMDCDRNFVGACLGQTELLVTAKQGTYVQRLISALYNSALKGES